MLRLPIAMCLSFPDSFPGLSQNSLTDYRRTRARPIHTTAKTAESGVVKSTVAAARIRQDPPGGPEEGSPGALWAGMAYHDVTVDIMVCCTEAGAPRC